MCILIHYPGAILVAYDGKELVGLISSLEGLGVDDYYLTFCEY